MRMRAEFSRGFVLVTTLILLIVVAMMVSAALALLPGSRLMSGTVASTEGAVAAAQAGIEYARTRLQENPNWRGNGNGVIVDRPGDFWVREAEGNVLGIIWTSQGTRSMFRLRFNYQNGGGSPDDGFSNPPSEMRSRSVYVSQNNLAGSSARPLYRASASDFRVSGSEVAANDLPKYTAAIYSEGLAGPGLDNVSPSQIQVNPAMGRGVTTVVVEAFLGRDVSRFGDAVLYGARDVSLDVDRVVKIESRDRSTPPRARTMGDFQVASDLAASSALIMEDGEAHVKPATGRFTINGADSTSPAATRTDSRGQFLQLGWDEIDKATASDATLPAGTYLWRSNPTRLDYFAQDIDPATTPLPSPNASYTDTSQLPSSVSGALRLDAQRLKLKITKNILVTPSGSASGITIASEPGVMAELGLRPETELQTPATGEASPIITTEGNFKVQGRLRGNGAVTAVGDITFQGESVLEADKGSKVAVYSRSDISIEAIPNEVVDRIDPASGGGGGPMPVPVPSGTPGAASVAGFFQGALPPFGPPRAADVAFAGIVYSQGNFRVDTGSSSNFHLHGMLVAYGGDSGAGELPGDRADSGYVSIKSENAQFFYDSSFVANLIDQNAATKLDVVSWRRL